MLITTHCHQQYLPTYTHTYKHNHSCISHTRLRSNNWLTFTPNLPSMPPEQSHTHRFPFFNVDHPVVPPGCSVRVSVVTSHMHADCALLTHVFLSLCVATKWIILSCVPMTTLGEKRSVTTETAETAQILEGWGGLMCFSADHSAVALSQGWNMTPWIYCIWGLFEKLLSWNTVVSSDWLRCLSSPELKPAYQSCCSF